MRWNTVIITKYMFLVPIGNAHIGKFLLARSMRTQADLVDQLFNSSEKRLARILLLMAEFGKRGEPESLIPKITEETLAEMIGTTRSRVSFFMNRFRRLGFSQVVTQCDPPRPPARRPGAQ
jgi:CRP-like cAMP-binding protein